MKPTRILVVRLGAMGDIVHTLPAVATLKQSFPHSHIAWALERKWAPLLEGNVFVDEPLFFDRNKLSEIWRLRSQLRQNIWDLAVDFQGLLKSAVVASFARPERIIGFHRSQVREKLAALFYSATARAQATHIVDRNLELAAAAGASNIVRSFAIPQGHPEGVLPSGEFVLANPAAGWKGKQWPMENYVELARRLQSQGVRLVLNVASKISGLEVQQHISALPGLIDATRRAVAVVGVDSGPLHIAAALGKAGVAIFGPTDPARHGPYGGSMSVLRSPIAKTTYKRGTEVDPSMRAISVDQVMSALKERLLCPAG